MRATSRLLTITHHECANHEPVPGHPERPARLRAAIAGAALDGAEIRPAITDEHASLSAISRVHAAGHAARLEAACRDGQGLFDSADNPIGAGTYRAAWRAVAACLDAAAAVCGGEAARVWAPVRPPGHHALYDRALGFCYFNNVAVLAEELLARGRGPLAVVDFDVHHGNGTQQHFWERRDVYYLSAHQYPHFPGSGGADEVGEGEGEGYTRNLPLAAGSGDDVVLEALRIGLDEMAGRVTPEVFLVSAGFDGHVDDPLSDLCLTEQGFRRIGELLSEAARERPMIAVLEGGYEIAALQSSVRSFLEGAVGVARP